MEVVLEWFTIVIQLFYFVHILLVALVCFPAIAVLTLLCVNMPVKLRPALRFTAVGSVMYTAALWAHPVPIGYLLASSISMGAATPVLLLEVFGLDGIQTMVKDPVAIKRLNWQLLPPILGVIFLCVFSSFRF